MFDSEAARERCRRFRRKLLDISRNVPALHLAPSFSCLELLDFAYFGLVDQFGSEDDAFILSKGHAAVAQYVVLNDRGVLNDNILNSYCSAGSKLGAHPDRGLPGIIASTGSLGHGLGLAVGLAYGMKLQRKKSKVIALVSDGELQEGSSWEALMMARNLHLENLICLVDYNDFTGMDRLSVTHPGFGPLLEKFVAFGWSGEEVDGHDQHAILNAFYNISDSSQPKVIIGRTIKGKGVSFMENVPIWHYRSPSEEEYQIALRELDNQ